MERAEAEVAKAGRHDSQSGVTRTVLNLPLEADHGLTTLCLSFWHPNPGHEGWGRSAEDDDRAPETRFEVEVDLSRLGPLRLIGVVDDARLDLVLESPRALPPSMRGALRDRFDLPLATAGLKCALQFRLLGEGLVSDLVV